MGDSFGLESALWFAKNEKDAHEEPTFKRSRSHEYVLIIWSILIGYLLFPVSGCVLTIGCILEYSSILPFPSIAL